MLHRLILKVIKFQIPPPKRLSTVVKNILGVHHAPPMSNRVIAGLETYLILYPQNSSIPSAVNFFGSNADRFVPPVRNTKDTIVNSYGRKLIDTCISHNLTIVNGRVSGDLLGKYTSYHVKVQVLQICL